MSQTEDLFVKALELPDAERAELAARLIASLDDATDAGVAEAWQEEVNRRVMELESGQVAGVPWTEVRRALWGQSDELTGH
jgi:putative addiction module component (TIGR02574 family)